MYEYDIREREHPKKLVHLNKVLIALITIATLEGVNSNTTNMNRHNDKSKVDIKQNDSPNDENYEGRANVHDVDYTKVNFENNPYYNNEDFVHKFYSHENNAYSNYDVYKKYYLDPANPIPKSNVKFKISSRIVQTKYGKLQGIVLAMDEHKYLSPLEVFLGVPYATPPVGSNR